MRARGIALSVAGVLVLACVTGLALLIAGRERGWFPPDSPGGPPTVRLITAAQYTRLIHDLFGADIDIEMSFAPLQRRQGLTTLGASSAIMTPGAIEQFELSAREIATQVVDKAHRAVLIPCAPIAPRAADAECARTFFMRTGRYLYRRPLTENELAMQVATAGKVADELGDFYRGLAYGLAGMLTSPKFLYIAEMTEPDPDRHAARRLDAYSKATRLSLFFWDALPDEQLLDAAEKGELHTERGLERQISRLVASPSLQAGVRAFFTDMLGFDEFDILAKDPLIYPAFTRAMAASAKEQSLRLIAEFLVNENGDYRDLFTTNRTFINADLASFYHVPTSAPQDWVAVELDPDRSAGLLTSLSFLALHSHPGRSSPTRRGQAFREQLLCQDVPEPPPNVNFQIFDDPNHQFKTARERLDAHSTDPVCAGCHKITDPIGLALENFDGAGRFRSTENATVIDISGNLDGRPFEDLTGLGAALRDHPALGACVASRLFSYAVGREVTAADKRWLSYIVKRFAVGGYSVVNLMQAMAEGEAFFAMTEEKS